MTLTTILLIASVSALCVGPFLFRLAKDREWAAFLDGFALVTVVGLASVHLLPEAFSHGGLLAVVVSIFGFVFPTAIERLAANGAKLTAIVFLFGLVPHVFLESAALGGGSESHIVGLGIAIVAHRLPFSLLIFSMFHERYGNRSGWIAIGVVALATIVGFLVGGQLVKTVSPDIFVLLNAFVGGALLHIVSSHIFHDEETHDCSMHGEPSANTFQKSRWSGAGGLLGVLTLAFAFGGHETHSHGDHIDFFQTAWNVVSIAAPGLLAAVLASLVLYQLSIKVGPISLANALHVSVGISRRLAVSARVDGPLRFVAQGASFESIALTLAFLPMELTGAWIATLGLVTATCLILGQVLITDRVEKAFEATLPDPSRWFEQVVPWLVAGLFVAIWADCLLEHRPMDGNTMAIVVAITFAAIVRAPAFFFAAMAVMVVHRGMPANLAIALLLIGPLLNPETIQRFKRKFGTAYAISTVVTVVVFAGIWGVFGRDWITATSGFDVHSAREISIPSMMAIATLGVIGTVQLFHDGPRLWLASIKQSTFFDVKSNNRVD